MPIIKYFVILRLTIWLTLIHHKLNALKLRRKLTIKLTIIVLLTAALTAFFYIHETFPKPLRAATSLLGTPTAIASGLSHYLNLGIPVYETPIAVVISNLIASVSIILFIDVFLKWREKRKQLNRN